MSRPLLAVLFLLLALPGCEAIAGIFQAGMWVGALGLLVVVLLIWFIASRVGRG